LLDLSDKELWVTTISTQPGPARATEPGRAAGLGRLLHARPDDPAWARPALLALLAGTAALYLVGLSRNGWANEFYAGAAQAGTQSWKAFLFGSLDSSNFITVDKPPAFLWVMELSGRVFGVNYWSLLVPQALEGVATVGVLYTTVRRWFGPSAAIIAGAVLALVPVATLIFRFNDPDALLTLTMTLAAYATTCAIESGRTRWLALAGALLGLGFLTKMLAAFLVLPGLALAYLWCGPPRLGRRILQLLAGGAALLAAAGWWVAIVLLTPAADRPFVGSTTDNNILQLTFGYNGLSRLTGGQGGPGGAARAGGGGFGGGFGGGSGLTRLFQAEWGGQVSWLIPAALIALAAMLWLSRRGARPDRTRAAALLWGGWLAGAGLVLSFMSGTTHSYYSVALVPAIGALTGIGAVGLWRARSTWLARAVLAAALAATGAWAWLLLGRSPGWFPWLRVVILVAALLGAGLMLAGPRVPAVVARWGAILAPATVSLAVIAGLGGPLAYSLDTAARSNGGSSPSAGPVLTAGGGLGAGRPGRGAFPGRDGFPGSGRDATARDAAGGFTSGSGRSGRLGGFAGSGGGNTTVSAAVVKLLESGASRYTWTAATDGSDTAAAMELAAGGVPVMAIGGFRGSDPAPSLAAFERLVAAHKIHYYVAGGGFGLAGGGFGLAGGGFGLAGGGFGLAGGGPGRGGSGASGDAAHGRAGYTGSGESGYPGGDAFRYADDGGSRYTGGDGSGHAGNGGSGYAGSGRPGGPGRANATDASQIAAWVEAHFTARTVGGMTVYNLTAPARRS
jgi:4-amino-4-deoxy-L-arabinose transferase-like glycosyltransferase